MASEQYSTQEIEKSKEDIKSVEENNQINHILINLRLVDAGVKSITIVEHLYTGEDTLKKIGIFKNGNKYKIPEYPNLKVTEEHTDNILRLIIGKKELIDKIKDKNLNDAEIGELLGFLCVGWDYFNNTKNRRVIELMAKKDDLEINISTEVCPIDEDSKFDLPSIQEFYEEKIKEYSRILPEYTLFINITKSISLNMLKERLYNEDYKFIVTNASEYVNAIYNYWSENEQSIVYSIFQNRDIEKLKQYIESIKLIFRYFVMLNDITKLRPFIKKFERQKITLEQYLEQNYKFVVSIEEMLDKPDELRELIQKNMIFAKIGS